MTFPIEGYMYTPRGLSRYKRDLLLDFLKRTYRHLYPNQTFDHLEHTVKHYFSADTPTWWVSAESDPDTPIAGLWLGNSIDQISGDRHAYVFMLFVEPQHRRRGIGSTLMHLAEKWAAARGDRQLGLQVFVENQPALNLYEKLGFQPQALWMIKPISRC
jgi:ribosomal protein S18 acetylase RimI-like enzyme